MIDRLDEEFLLFAIHRDGAWVSRRHGSVRHGIAAAWLLELLRDGKVRQIEKNIVPKGKSPMDDEAIDPLLKLIQQSPKPRTAMHWLRVFAKKAPESIPAVARRLQGRGYIDIVTDARGKERYPSHRAESRAELRRHLLRVLAGTIERDLASIDLLCAMGAAGMTEEAFGNHDRREAEHQIQQLIHFDPHLLYMWRSVRRLRRWKIFARAPPYEVPEVQFRNLGQSTIVRQKAKPLVPPWTPDDGR